MNYRTPDPSEIITRLKTHLDVESDAKLAEILGIPPSTLANWRRRRSLPYAVCVRIAQERGISLDWLILGKKGLVLDTSALALAAYHSRVALSLLELGEVEADVLGEAISKWYGEYVGSLNRAVATGRTREQATRQLYDTLSITSLTGAITEAVELQSQRRPSGIPESEHEAPDDPEGEEQTKAPEAGLAEGSETSVEREETPAKFRRTRSDSNEPVGYTSASRRRFNMGLTIAPGPEHISPEQANALKALIREAADYQVAIGTAEPRAVEIVSRLVSRTFGVLTPEMIPRELGDDAIDFVTQHIAGLRTRDDEADFVPWRTALYADIYHTARFLEYSRDELFDIAFDLSGKRITTLKQLSDEHLGKLCGTIMATRRERRYSS